MLLSTIVSSHLSSKYPKDVNKFKIKSNEPGLQKLRISLLIKLIFAFLCAAFSLALDNKNGDMSTPVKL